jgi:hypothetical protein
MRNLDSWNKHENPYSRRFGPDLSFMMKRTGNRASPASTAVLIVALDPDSALSTHAESRKANDYFCFLESCCSALAAGLLDWWS